MLIASQTIDVVKLNREISALLDSKDMHYLVKDVAVDQFVILSNKLNGM